MSIRLYVPVANVRLVVSLLDAEEAVPILDEGAQSRRVIRFRGETWTAVGDIVHDVACGAHEVVVRRGLHGLHNDG